MPRIVTRTARTASTILALACLAALAPASARAEAVHPGPVLAITRATGPISVDGDLNDPGWKGVTPITTWFETNVGDNVEPPVKSTAWVTFDDHYLYAAFLFNDPHPELIRAPVADHDQLSGSTDYGGILLDSNNDGKSAIEFLANANGLQYDAINNDASGEDASPDWYWDSAGKITSTGWQLEIRVPFSSLRYSHEANPTWGIMLYRNYPRERHYQCFTARLPRNSNCFICNESALTGLAGLPHASNLVVAPYVTAQRSDAAAGDPGTPIVDGKVQGEAGADVKWSPLASLAVDATIHPDFSQVESDVAQIATNERFALFYPEKRSFFLEGIDLFSTPLQAVYTRSITSPSAGGRVTGRVDGTSYTALVAHDRGDGLVILPGPEASGFALQDFSSDVGIVRIRHDIGASWVSLLATGRNSAGGAHDDVVGPDVRWQPRPTDTFAAQALWSEERTPTRLDLAPEWDGRELSDRALIGSWTHTSRTYDVYAQEEDLGPDFRANEGFIPQVDMRQAYLQAGYSWHPLKAFFSRIRMFNEDYYTDDHTGSVLARHVQVGAGADGKFNTFYRIELNRDDIKAGDRLFTRFRPYVKFTASPNRLVNNFSFEAYLNDEVDFDNARLGKGTTLITSVSLRPNDHLELAPNASVRWLNVDDPALGSGRLFLAQVARLRATWSFNSHVFARVIGQYVRTSRDTSLYTFEVTPKDENFDSSALLAYKLNWQTVFYVGYGDNRALDDSGRTLVQSGRQVFAKVSYAIQR